SLPIKLSHNQIQALQNAWNRDISYIQGPPGTGKSYTISAIALSAIFLGKKVLVISQKIPALNVVRNFIEPFLKFDTRLQGIMYYDHNLRKNIKDHINHLLSLSGERELRNNIKFIQSQLSEKENRLEKILKDISEITIALKNNLEDEKNYKTINQEFQKLKKDFSNYYNYRINSDFAFIICREQEKKRYEKLAEKYNCIFSHQCRTLSSKLFLLKYKEFLKKIFNVNINNIDDSILPDFSKHIFEINFTLTKLNEKYNRLKKTNELLRKRIENNEKEVLLLKEEILKLRHKLSIFTLLDSRNHIEALQKFKSLLHFRNTSIIADKISDIDYIKILEIMPFWVAEIRHLNQLFPMKHDLFDIVIVDESSQVNLAEVIPAFYRGKQICVVGDDKQLGLDSTGVNFQLNKTFDMFIWSKYFKNTTLIYETGKAKKLTVSDSSILDFLINEFNNIHPSRVMLDEHFRSMPLLANYTNSRFYNNELKIMTETGDKIFTNSFITFKVNGERDHNKIILKEAERIISIIKEITSNANDNTALFIEEQIIKLPESIKKPFSIGIISMIRNQCDFISDLLEEKINDTIINEYDIMVGTPEEFQGHEKDIMIFSLCLDRNCSRGTQFFQNDKRLNVATSRAKKLMIFVYSEIPNNFTKIIDCVKYFGINPEIVEPNNKAVYPEYNPLSWKLNFDKYESEFEKQVYFYLKEYAEHKSKNGEIQIFNQVKSCGQKRLDFVVYNSKTNKFVAIEVDGSSHFLDDGFRYSEKHIERIEILKRAGWNIINTPYYLWYKNGWLADKNDNNYKRELERIYSIIDSNILGKQKKSVIYLRPAVRAASVATFQDTAQARRRQVLSVKGKSGIKKLKRYLKGKQILK
ncbi:hypothetical protein KAZ01_01710, partial [Candidatus Gracilibacteria bacterium]|nr:hypothetical protein [Candidatus Gracilibacteria bacterium]